MSSENSFTKIPREGLPLQIFLRKDHQLFLEDPERYLSPLVAYLASVHDAGEAHGAILPGCMVVSQSGKIDIELLNSRRGYPEKSELPIYYPEGMGADAAEAKIRDLQALAAVLHLIITDHPPARRDRRPLSENPAAKSWSPAFLGLVDRMLDGTASLSELSASLSSAPSVEISQPLSNSPPEPVLAPPAEAPRAKAPSGRFPNAMVGREYFSEIPIPESWGTIEIERIEALSEIPAGLEIREKSLVGNPTDSGDFEIRVGLHLPGRDANISPPLEVVLSLTINPDPRSLWKNLPSAEDDPFWKPDSAVAWLMGGPLEIAGASLRGRSHAHVGSFRDDDLAMSWFPESSWYSLTVADGAGSSKYSRRGSQIACETVLAHLGECLSRTSEPSLESWVAEWAAAPDDPAGVFKIRTTLYNFFGHAVFKARNAIDEEAVKLNAVARDFHTTLITSLVHPLPDGRWFIATFSIGDGAAAVIGAPGGEPCLLTRPDGGEFAGQTVFLTMKEALATTEAIMGRINFHIVPEFKGLLLVTDGISDPRFDSDVSLADPVAWDSLWEEVVGVISSAANGEEASAALVEWMAFHSPGHHDDRTVILAKPANP